MFQFSIPGDSTKKPVNSMFTGFFYIKTQEINLIKKQSLH